MLLVKGAHFVLHVGGQCFYHSLEFYIAIHRLVSCLWYLWRQQTIDELEVIVSWMLWSHPMDGTEKIFCCSCNHITIIDDMSKIVIITIFGSIKLSELKMKYFGFFLTPSVIFQGLGQKNSWDNFLTHSAFRTFWCLFQRFQKDKARDYIFQFYDSDIITSQMFSPS